jgi:hypothetical protein
MFNLQGLQIIPVLPIELVQIVVFLLQAIYLLCSLLNSSNSQTNFVGKNSSSLKVTVQIFSDQVCCSCHPQQVERKSQNFALLNITWAYCHQLFLNHLPPLLKEDKHEQGSIAVLSSLVIAPIQHSSNHQLLKTQMGFLHHMLTLIKPKKLSPMLNLISNNGHKI